MQSPACLDAVEGVVCKSVAHFGGQGAAQIAGQASEVAAGALDSCPFGADAEAAAHAANDDDHRCRHRHAGTRLLCGEALDDRGHHAAVCEVGGGVVHRHDGVRDWLAGWIAAMSSQTVSTEQFVPTWDKVREDGTILRARLDVVFQDTQARTAYADIAIVAASSVCSSLKRARAARDGAAAARAEDGKRMRYPGPNLVPFVIELLGRPGADAIALLRSFAPRDPMERSEALGKAWQALSVQIQIAHAEQLLSAQL
jgi:hypothetical protein